MEERMLLCLPQRIVAWALLRKLYHYGRVAGERVTAGSATDVGGGWTP